MNQRSMKRKSYKWIQRKAPLDLNNDNNCNKNNHRTKDKSKSASISGTVCGNKRKFDDTEFSASPQHKRAKIEVNNSQNQLNQDDSDYNCDKFDEISTSFYQWQKNVEAKLQLFSIGNSNNNNNNSNKNKDKNDKNVNKNKNVKIDNLNDYAREKQSVLELNDQFIQHYGNIVNGKKRAKSQLKKQVQFEKNVKNKIDKYNIRLQQTISEKDAQLMDCRKQLAEIQSRIKRLENSKIAICKQHEDACRKQMKKLEKYTVAIEDSKKIIEKWNNLIDQSGEISNKLGDSNKLFDNKYWELVQDWQNWDEYRTREFLKYGIYQKFGLSNNNHNNTNNDNSNHGKEYTQLVDKRCQLNGKDLTSLNLTGLKLLGIKNNDDCRKLLTFVKQVTLHNFDNDDDDKDNDNCDEDNSDSNDYEDDDETTDSDIDGSTDTDSSDNRHIMGGGYDKHERKKKSKIIKSKSKKKSKSKSKSVTKGKIRDGYTCICCNSNGVAMRYRECGHACICKQCYQEWSDIQGKSECPSCNVPQSGADEIIPAGVDW